jgi:hypothetical protein
MPIGDPSSPALLSSDASTGKAVKDMAAPMNRMNARELGASQSAGWPSALTCCGSK